MPLYEYRCPACGQAFEEIRKMDERGSAPCPKCGAAAEKSLSTFSAVVGSCCSPGTGGGSGSCCSGGSCGCGG